MDYNVLLQQLVNGLGQGAIYALIAVGYTMVYGILGLINFAHGDVFAMAPIIVLSVYLPAMLYALPLNGINAGVALLIAIVFCGTLGFLVERIAYRPLRKPYGLRTCLIITLLLPPVFYGTSRAIPNEVNVRPGDPARLSVLIQSQTPEKPLTVETATEALRPKHRAARDTAAGWRRVLEALSLATAVYGLGLLLNRWAFTLGVGSSDRLTALITAIGISIFLQNTLQLEELYGSRQKIFPAEMFERPAAGPLDPPPAEAAVLHLGPVSLSRIKAVVLVSVVVLMLVLTWIVRYTRIGRAMRAVSYSHDAARLMGVNVDVVISTTFVVGSTLAAVGGLLYAATYPTSINPLMGAQPGTKAFTAAVLGGIGNIPGAVLGSLIMGVCEALLSANKSLSLFAEGLSFLTLILILLLRPAGLLGRNVPEKV